MKTLALVLAAVLCQLGCTFKPDPDQDTFTCTATPDCGDGYACVPQKDGSARSLCVKSSSISAETCNGADDDHDGLIDNDVPEVGQPCDSGLKGECAKGSYDCVVGELVCVAPKPALEICNGKDDNCNGSTDEGFNLQIDPLNCGACGKACGTGAACVAGKCEETACSDSLDNDGNGLTDCLDPVCLGKVCAAADATRNCGKDGAGKAACVAKESLCGDGLDNDGDGKTDCADPDCDGKACATGTCAAGLCKP